MTAAAHPVDIDPLSFRGGSLRLNPDPRWRNERTPPAAAARLPCARHTRRAQTAARSKRSRSMTLSQAATKSPTNFPATPRTGVDLGERAQLGVEPNTRSTAVASTLTGPSHVRAGVHVLRRLPTLSTPWPCPAGARKSRWSMHRTGTANTPNRDPPCSQPILSARSPPTSTVISGAVSVSRCCGCREQPPRARVFSPSRR